MTEQQVKIILEAAIFAASEPMNMVQLKKLFADDPDIDLAIIKQQLAALAEDWQERGIELKEVASGFRFQVKADFVPYIKNLWQERPPRYSRAFLETLALIAYRQPITRAEIEDIRGVATASNVIKTMLERNWVRVVGQRDMPGRPELLATTHEFLDYFNLKSLEELPSLRELQNIEEVSEHILKLLGNNIESSEQSHQTAVPAMLAESIQPNEESETTA